MIAYSRLPDSRRFYEYIYELMNGSYEIKPYLTEMNDNLLRGLPYTHNVTDSAHWYKDKTIDTDCTFLTDGLAGGNFYGDRYLGVKNKDVTIDFDFDGKKAIKELHTYTFEDQSAALFLPENLKVYAKNDGELVLLYSGEVPSEHTVISLDSVYYADGLVFEFTRHRTYLFIKEVMAFSEDTGITPDFIVETPTTNWILGDVTNDGIINNADVMQINRKVANFSSVFDIEEYKEQRFKASDVNKDGVINNIDAMQINRKVANLGSVFDKNKGFIL